MSMMMTSKSEEAEEDTENTTATDERPRYGWRPRFPVWWIRAAAVGLGLLLLVVIFGLVAHNASALGQRDSLLDQLMTREKQICNLTMDNKALRDELKQVKVNSNRLTEELEELQSLYNTVAASRDNLLQEYTTLNSSTASAHARAISQRDVLQGHLMKCEKMIHNLTTDNNVLGDELKQMKVNSSRLTEDNEQLQRLYNNVATSRDNLLQEYTTLNSSAACRVCRRGWIKFSNKCYYLSPIGQTKNWEDSRKDCQQRGADLVKPTTKEEQGFVFTINRISWIGLSDRKQEGKWLWVDGTALQTGIWNSGEPNNVGDEDCVMVGTHGKWNDALCSSALSWMCED